MQRKLAVSGAERRNGDGLTIAVATAPDQRHLNRSSGAACEHDASGVAVVLAHHNSTLRHAVRLAPVELHFRRMVAGVAVLSVHRDYILTTDGTPPPRDRPIEPRISRAIGHHR